MFVLRCSRFSLTSRERLLFFICFYLSDTLCFPTRRSEAETSNHSKCYPCFGEIVCFFRCIGENMQILIVRITEGGVFCYIFLKEANEEHQFSSFYRLTRYRHHRSIFLLPASTHWSVTFYDCLYCVYRQCCFYRDPDRQDR